VEQPGSKNPDFSSKESSEAEFGTYVIFGSLYELLPLNNNQLLVYNITEFLVAEKVPEY
jgi:hypothetical protein